MSIEYFEQNTHRSSFSLTESYLRRIKFVLKYKFKLIIILEILKNSNFSIFQKNYILKVITALT